MREFEHIYRDRGQQKIVLLFGLIFSGLLIGMAVEANHLDSRIFSLFVLLIYLVFCARGVLAGIEVSEAGVRVMNVFWTTFIPWAEIEKFDVGRSALHPMVCLIHLEKGRIKTASAIQERKDNGFALGVVDELNTELMERRPAGG